MKILKVIAVLLSIFTSASVNAKGEYGTFDDNPKKPFDASNHNYETMLITWKVVKDVNKECNKMRIKRGVKPFGFSVDACSTWNGRMCTIITKTKPTMWSVGHEIRHCYEGDWH